MSSKRRNFFGVEKIIPARMIKINMLVRPQGLVSTPTCSQARASRFTGSRNASVGDGPSLDNPSALSGLQLLVSGKKGSAGKNVDLVRLYSQWKEFQARPRSSMEETLKILDLLSDGSAFNDANDIFLCTQTVEDACSTQGVILSPEGLVEVVRRCCDVVVSQRAFDNYESFVERAIALGEEAELITADILEEIRDPQNRVLFK